MKKIQKAINKPKKGKASEKNGIRAGDIKTCDNETKEMRNLVFNEVSKQEKCTPEISRRRRRKVIPRKKGNEEDVGNYRPICTLAALYKLFSTILYNRLYPVLDQIQSEDQGGFRRSYQAIDHLATYRMIEQKCHEWGVKLWIATTDCMKAFDSINRNSLWDALKNLWYRT